jgi:hypothetical protein
MAQCEVCGTEMIQGRGRARRTCSHACRQAVYRRNRAAHEAELRRSASPMVKAASDLAAAATEAASLALHGFPVNLTTLSRRYDALMAAAGAAGLIPPIVTRDVPAARATETVARTVTRDVPATAAAGTVAPTVTRDDSAAARPEAAAGTVTRDDSASTKPAPARKGIEPRPQKLPKKKAAAVIDAAELVRADDYHDTHRWILRSGDTVLGYVEPSYGGASQSGRNGWISRMGGTPGPRCKSRDGAAVDLAARWRRVVTAAPRR